MKCSICGKEYIKNPILNMLPESLRDKLTYIPDCQCEHDLLMQEKESKQKEEWELQRKKARTEKIKKYRDISVYDEKFLSSTFENTEKNKFVGYAYKYAKSFVTKDNAPGILFYGKPGVGKTRLAGCIANFLMKYGKTVLTLNMSRYLSRLRKDWSEAEIDLLDHVEKVDLLIIDDLGVENMTPWTYEKIFNLIDKRYRSNKATLITTNLNYNSDESKNELAIKFKDAFGNNRIGDRINEMCYPVFVDGESRRKPATNQFLEFLS